MSETTYGDVAGRKALKRIHLAVANVAALSSVPLNELVDGRLFLAQAENTIWAYNAASTASSGTYVKLPLGSPSAGRFLRTDSTLAASVAGLVSDISGLTCLSGDAVGDWVYVSAASTVAKADADDTAKIPAIGVIVSKESTTSCTVRVSGLVTGASGLTAGATYYLSTTAGQMTATAPAAPNAVPVAVALSTTSYVVLPAGPAFARLRSKGILNGLKYVPIPVSAWRIVSAGGDVGNIAAIGGVPASNSDPILRGDANNSWELFWAAGSVVPIGVQVPILPDLDDTANVTLTLSVASGTTDAATMGIASSWDGGSEVTDSADDSGTKSATRHLITATIAAADVPAGASHVTFRITPPTHGTDGISLFTSYLSYTPKAV